MLDSSYFKWSKEKSKEFDLWFHLSSGESISARRLKVPCKRTSIFNQALKLGELRNSIKLWKSDKGIFYAIAFVKFLKVPKKRNEHLLAIDTGINNPFVNHKGEFFGREVNQLRVKTKYRKYEGLSTQKQYLNRLAKRLVSDNPDTDFVFEDLLFVGKGDTDKGYRKRNNTWAYKHLSRKLKELSESEGFKVYLVNPAFTSQTCYRCGLVYKGNRVDEEFHCLRCDYTNHSDINAALNMLERVPQEKNHSEPVISTTNKVENRLANPFLDGYQSSQVLQDKGV
jgi:IS605 OrfB family transposase